MAYNRSPFHKIWARMAKVFAYFGLGMRAKLVLLFILIKVIPLILLALVAWNQATELGHEMRTRTHDMAMQAMQELDHVGDLAVDDAVKSLDNRATDEIERMTTDAAKTLANFLYARDDDLRFLVTLNPSEHVFRDFLASKTALVIKARTWKLSDDKNSWVPTTEHKSAPEVRLQNAENQEHFRTRPPDNFEYERVPLYLEATYIDLEGRELIKVTTSDLLDPALKDVSDKKNTFCKAEEYFSHLKKLQAGEIYVSEVIGEYVGSNLVGMYTPENARKKGVAYEPEKAAYVGDENPNGKRFRGLVRFAMPLEQQGKIVGYVTIALNHDHIISKVEHLVPYTQRYSDINAAAEGNYTFMWDNKGYNIFHPRHHSIAGFNAQTGERHPPLLDSETYDKWQNSGLSYVDFIEGEAPFSNQSRDKKPAIEQLQQGIIGLDCRYLNFAPQCTDWYNLAQHGGSGSFFLLWSGLWKLTTVSAIPYYTSHYGQNLIGFGIVTMTVGIDDFHRPAMEMQETIQALIQTTDEELAAVSEQTFNAITNNIWDTAVSLSLSTLFMTVLVVLVAIWMAFSIAQKITFLIHGIFRFSSGHRIFRFESENNDEFGVLCHSLNELFDGIDKSTKNPLTITDLDKNILYMNKLALDILGKSFEEVEGKFYPALSIFGNENGSITTFLASQPAVISYYAATQRYYKGRTSYLVDKKNNNVGFIIEAEDVTQLIIEQEKIERERALLDMVLSASPDTIWYKTTEGVYLTVNPRFASMMGLPPEEIQGKRDRDLLQDHVYAFCAQQDQEVIHTGMPTYHERLTPFADGHEEVLDIVRTPIFGADGTVRGILGVGRDVSLRVDVEKELRQTQRELLHAVNEANEASKAKSEFLARMSHEIRTPMNAIIGMTNIIKRKLFEKEFSKDDLHANMLQIESSSIHLLGLLNDILDISKIETGKIDISYESFDISQLITDVSSIIAPRCESKNITFTVNVTDLEKTHFISDELRIRQILLNLLGNAVKFTPELGTVSFHVTQKKRADDKSLISFSIVDTGIGISPEKLHSLFVPFEQGGGHITRMYGGTGLGLSISRSIASLLDSEIEVRTEENKGSEFYFSLWLMEDTQHETSSIHKEVMTILPGKRILLVDDVDVNRIIAMELLSPFDLIIDEAADGTEAVEMYAASAEGHYDLILMDIQMPKMNGYEATSTIRALDRPDAKTTPILAMTANTFKDDIDMAFASGMNAHIAKPISPEILYNTVGHWLAAREQPVVDSSS